MTANTTPLSPDDFDQQEAVLDALREHDETVPDWEFCEGFLAALVCTRRPMAPDEYWPALLGRFNPAEHMEFVWRWRRRWQAVAEALDNDEVQSLEDEHAYQPEVLDVRGALASQPPGDGQALPPDELERVPSFAQTWALGFITAVDCFADDWVPPRDRDAAQMLDESVAAIIALIAPDTGVPAVSMYEEDGPPSVSEARLEAYGAAIWAVYELRQLWKSLGPRIEPLLKPVEPGRNDPCPCGSGKKYKKCHGA